MITSAEMEKEGTAGETTELNPRFVAGRPRNMGGRKMG